MVIRMKYTTFGKTGWKVSAIGFGCWQAGMNSWGSDYSSRDASDAIRAATDAGINFFDTAEIYGHGVSERTLGESVKGRDVFIATKVAGYNVGRIEKSVERSLRNLGRSIDLYQLHWVPSLYTSLEKSIRKLESAVRSGKVAHIGLSNFPANQLKVASESLAREEIVSNQVQYSLVDRRVENSLSPLMTNLGIMTIAYSPLGRGRLTGKYFDSALPSNTARFTGVRRGRYSPPDKLKSALKKIASDHNFPVSAVSLSWLLSKNVIPIPGAKRPDQAVANAASADLELSGTEISILDSASNDQKSGEYGNLVPRIIPNAVIRLLFEGFV